MKNIFRVLFFLITAVVFITNAQKAHGMVQTGDDEGEVVIAAEPAKKDAIFGANSAIHYKVDLDNRYNMPQSGTVSYQILSIGSKPLTNSSVSVKLNKKSKRSIDLSIPRQAAGFYKINIMVNLSDYDDTIKRVFGVTPEQIRSEHAKPADFDAFWQKAKDELAKVTPDFKVTEYPDSSRDNRRVFGIEMKSLGGITVRGWMTIPKTTNHRKKFPVLLGLPGYQVNLKPMFGSDEDLAIVVLNVRGQGNSRDRIRTLRDDYIFYNLEDKNRYVMRGAIMDCVRMIDFIFSREELDHDNIMVSGGSMGGFLSIATAGVDHRVKLCSAQNPILCDVQNLPGKVTWPVKDFSRYIRTQRGLTMDKLLANLSYFDTKNFASNIKCPTLMGIGLLDHLAPPDNEYAAYNSLTVPKHMIIFRDLGHEVAVYYKEYEGRWMRDTFGLF
ncbi:alpha/beta fold hydrolase [Mucilaginibacter sp. Bleaf8]|uniref:acetylxylan esterase n=1 Tax=Mucilaginibacter sp. Bleaf8 TaxID=2834430 RepID=UPI001BCDCED7|nr:alpha/beta fold hydrolase [Mucilaginibacter sp. Bleaf8]MBS7566970.1 alpha/beta fold hydrolase [Mucilaginibacter sp. Bleaf8]